MKLYVTIVKMTEFPMPKLVRSVAVKYPTRKATISELEQMVKEYRKEKEYAKGADLLDRIDGIKKKKFHEITMKREDREAAQSKYESTIEEALHTDDLDRAVLLKHEYEERHAMEKDERRNVPFRERAMTLEERLGSSEFTYEEAIQADELAKAVLLKDEYEDWNAMMEKRKIPDPMFRPIDAPPPLSVEQKNEFILQHELEYIRMYGLEYFIKHSKTSFESHEDMRCLRDKRYLNAQLSFLEHYGISISAGRLN
jgi:hypothetical protein